MDKYYYFVSELPTMFFDKESDITIDDFLQEAQKWLSVRDFQTLSVVNLFDTAIAPEDPQLLREYKEFEFRFISDLAAWRQSLQSGQEHKPSGFSLSLVREGDPFEVEIKLLRYRWEFIEEMEQEHHFDIEFLILYYLKLQILCKLARFNKEKGLQIFQKMSQATI